jgi:hypothetical protein
MIPVRIPARLLAALSLLSAVLALAPAAASAALPDPLDRGPHQVTTIDPFRAGTANLQEPNAAGGGTTGQASAVTLQVRGSLYMPADRTTPSPLIVLVHGNHASCDTTTPPSSGPQCSNGVSTGNFKRNDRGYAYLGENLATWGYTVVSLDQDQLMMYQDSAMGKGMHQRRILIAALLDALYKANAEAIPDDADNNLGDRLVGRIDWSTPIGLMGHSRGGDAVTSFIDYNRTRPEPGRRYAIGGVISLAPVDYERRAPWGTPYLTVLPYCDGDVSNLQGARFYERSQYIRPGDPFPRIQFSLHGANHGFFNTVWSADNDDQSGVDVACGPTAVNASTSIRLSGGQTVGASATPTSLLGTYTLANRASGDPSLMGDQTKAGLAMMSAFFRRYVGGETAFQPYMTGERSDTPSHRELPDSACPTSTTGTRIGCEERVMTSYFAPPAERVDLIRPETDNPLGLSALGTTLSGGGFVNPYVDGGGVNPKPATTPGGYDWCNPEPDHFAPSQLGLSSLPTAAKGCPLPAPTALGGQSGTRENAPINQSYGLQLALAWDRAATGRTAELTTAIPPASGDVSELKALAMGAAVNFFDDRNPDRSGDGLWNPAATTQDFSIVLTDADGIEGAVSAADPRYGNALHQTTGSTTSKTHVVLNGLRVPLADFAKQGVDLDRVRRITLRFGEIGKPGSGSVQVSDVRFQEAVPGSAVARRAEADPAAIVARRRGARPRPPCPARSASALGGRRRGRVHRHRGAVAGARAGPHARPPAGDRRHRGGRRLCERRACAACRCRSPGRCPAGAGSCAPTGG